MLSLGRVVVILFAVVVAFLAPTADGTPSLDWRLARVARDHSFNLWHWEGETLATRTSQDLFSPAANNRPTVVEKYAALTQQANRTVAERDQVWAKPGDTGSTASLAVIQSRLDQQENALALIRPVVEATVSQEIAVELARRGLPTNHYVSWDTAHLPFFHVDVIPPVFFQIGPLPQLLVIAPVDRVQLVGSVLLQPNLTTGEIDQLENGADALGVSSVVTDIGGLAAYPSMLSDDASTQDLLITVAHEWTHHYLAFRPLGQSYFDSYAMREINETVADMVGNEVGGAVYRDRYPIARAPSTPPVRPSPPETAPQPRRPDFYSEMRQIRVTVDAYLARHDIGGADSYMAAQQKILASQGYYVRRLNTAYLAFYGSYSGTANPYEAKLRELRSRSPNLGAFLESVSTMRQPQDLDRLLAR